VAPTPEDPAAAPIQDAGTGALPVFVVLSLAGLGVSAATMAVQWWRSRPG
jgi:hypothetical protein